MKNQMAITLSLFLCSLASAQSSINKGTMFYEARKYSEAENVFKSISEENADYAAAQYYLGRIAYDKKEYDDAVDYFVSATEANPKSGDYFNWLGDSYSAIGADAGILKQMSVGPKALRAWEAATKVDAKNINARVSLVGAYMMAPSFMGGGEDKAKAIAKEALTLLDNALKISPDNYLYHYWCGKCAALTGLMLELGEASLKKYVMHTPVGDEPSLAGAYMRLGQIKEKQGNNAEAKKNYEASLKLNEKMKGAREGLERVSKK